MHKPRKAKALIGPAATLCIGLALFLGPVAAGGKKPTPTPPANDGDYICEYGETGLPDCPARDFALEPTIEQGGLQILSFGPSDPGLFRLYQFTYTDADTEMLTWASGTFSSIGLTGPHVTVTGDIDGDGSKEFLLVLDRVTRTETVRHKTTTYCAPTVSWWNSANDPTPADERIGTEVSLASLVGEVVCSYVRDAAIGDADSDGRPELLLIRGTTLYMLEYSAGEWTLEATFTEPSTTLLRSVALGDVDGDNLNEVVLAGMGAGAPIVLHFETGQEGPELLSRSIGELPPALQESYASDLYSVYPRNVDNDSALELVASIGYRVGLWKYDSGSGSYSFLARSESLGNWVSADAGDFDGDSRAEIAAVAAGSSVQDAGTTLHALFKWNGSALVWLASVVAVGQQTAIKVGDLDGVDRAEFVTTHPLTVGYWECNDGAWTLVFPVINSAYGGLPFTIG